jgi:hexosaminidase
MKRKNIMMVMLFVFPVVCFSQKNFNRDTIELPVNNIIPKPVSVNVLKNKAVAINDKTVIVADAQFANQAEYLKEQIEDQCGLSLFIEAKPFKNASAIILNYDSSRVNKPEMYILSIKNGQVMVKAKDVEGIVHGIQTFLQLIPLQKTEVVSLAAVNIEDYPRFPYRGMHLDVSRHFFPVSYIKKYIDYLTFHKFNTFHWHLTDDQGWRIEIKGYPKLTTVGAWRDSTLVGHFRDKPARYDGIPHGGYYTQHEVKEIIEYAAVRGISIIPEIDIPGHSRAVIASYPDLSTSPDTAWQVGTAWGMYNRKNNVLAPNEKTFAFLKTVFCEIADLFPSPYIHIGGDETSKIWWKADPKTQGFMKRYGLESETALQTYFINQVIEDLKAKGKKVIGWDEILEGNLDSSAIIMNWRGVKAAIEAAKANHYVIMTPGPFTYLNYAQTKSKDSLTAGGYLPLDKVYGFEPVPKELNQEEAKYILGAQGNVWTEYIPYESKVEYMIFPRMTALSEVLWAQGDKKNFTDFKRRLKETVIPRYQFWNSNYFKEYEHWTLD